MTKLTHEQLNTLKALPYWDKIKDLTTLFEAGIISSDKFNDELIRITNSHNSASNDKPAVDVQTELSKIVDLIHVEGGSFMMGINGFDKKNLATPAHRVSLNSFYISKNLITQSIYSNVTNKNNPSEFIGNNNPVDQVSWFDAIDFCNKLSQKESLEKCYIGSGNNIICNFSANGYRLPTEAEWEFAARGGNDSMGYIYSGSNNPNDVAWFDENADKCTKPIGTKKPNELGIFDMSGNVWEWCWDWLNFYDNNTQSNPVGNSNGQVRALRGGCWGSFGLELLRTTTRNGEFPNEMSCKNGFRVVRSSK